MSITVKQMIEEMPHLGKIVMPPRTRISKRALISLIYYQRKLDEVYDQYSGKEWATLLNPVNLDPRCFPENTIGYTYRQELRQKKNKHDH